MALSLVSLPRLLLLSNSRTSRAFELLLSLRHSVVLWWWSVIIMCCELNPTHASPINKVVSNCDSANYIRP